MARERRAQRLRPVQEQEQGQARDQLVEQPAGGTSLFERRVGSGRPRPEAAREAIPIGRVERREVEPGRGRETAAVDHPASKGVILGERQHGVAIGAARLVPGRDELGRAGRVADVLVGRGPRSSVVALEQRGRAPGRASTSASFQARLSVSCTPLLKPRAPNGETRWAASPAKITGRGRNRSSRRHWKV